MIDKQTIANMRFVHGSYNFIVMFLLFYQGLLGLRIRKERIADKKSFDIIKRHRKTGPILALLGIFGFLAGATLVYLDYGNLLKYPFHLFFGSLIVFSLITAFYLSRQIKGTELTWRTPHFVLGIIIICLYGLQVFLGIGILF